MAGDSWTATLSIEDGLMVMDPGECDGDLRDIAGSNPGNMNVETPMAGEMVSTFLGKQTAATSKRGSGGS